MADQACEGAKGRRTPARRRQDGRPPGGEVAHHSRATHIVGSLLRVPRGGGGVVHEGDDRRPPGIGLRRDHDGAVLARRTVDARRRCDGRQPQHAVFEEREVARRRIQGLVDERGDAERPPVAVCGEPVHESRIRVISRGDLEPAEPRRVGSGDADDFETDRPSGRVGQALEHRPEQPEVRSVRRRADVDDGMTSGRGGVRSCGTGRKRPERRVQFVRHHDDLPCDRTDHLREVLGADDHDVGFPRETADGVQSGLVVLLCQQSRPRALRDEVVVDLEDQPCSALTSTRDDTLQQLARHGVPLHEYRVVPVEIVARGIAHRVDLGGCEEAEPLAAGDAPHDSHLGGSGVAPRNTVDDVSDVGTRRRRVAHAIPPGSRVPTANTRMAQICQEPTSRGKRLSQPLRRRGRYDRMRLLHQSKACHSL